MCTALLRASWICRPAENFNDWKAPPYYGTRSPAPSIPRRGYTEDKESVHACGASPKLPKRWSGQTAFIDPASLFCRQLVYIDSARPSDYLRLEPEFGVASPNPGLPVSNEEQGEQRRRTAASETSVEVNRPSPTSWLTTRRKPVFIDR